MVDLPLELVTLILCHMSEDDLLENARFVNREWSRIALKEIVRDKIFHFEDLDILRRHLNCFLANPNAPLPINYVEFNMMEFDQSSPYMFYNRDSFDAYCSLATAVARHLSKIDWMWLFFRIDTRRQPYQGTFIQQLVQNSTMKKLTLDVTMPPPFLHNLLPFITPHLCSLELQTGNGSQSRVDLGFMLSLLRRFPSLKTVMMDFVSCKVDGVPLADFVCTSLAEHPQHFNMDTVNLLFWKDRWDRTTPQERPSAHLANVALFFWHLMPRLRHFLISIHDDMIHQNLPLDCAMPPLLVNYPKHVRVLYRDPPTGSQLPTPADTMAAVPLIPCVDTDTKLMDVELGYNSISALALIPRSRINTLEIGIASGDHDRLKTLPLALQGLTSLTRLEFYGNGHLPDVESMFPVETPNCNLKELEFRRCTLDDPGALERMLLRLPALATLRLSKLNFASWSYEPTMLFEHPWVPALRSFIVPLQWMSLPTDAAEISIDHDFEKSRVCFVLASDAPPKEPNVQVWTHRNLEYYDTSTKKGPSRLRNGYLPWIFERIVSNRKLRKTTAPRPGYHPGPLVLHDLYAHPGAIVYMCKSLKQVKICERKKHVYDLSSYETVPLF
ncbi:hypothetical protein BC940DRAFT_311145 [Gongronella butleri]|nr:hypothetical protein BC940DRAFT_311145 [Gongronella butleri]